MAKYFTLRFSCENEAFICDGDPSFEVARILHELAARIEDGLLHELPGKHRNVLDWNGNIVGTFVLRDEDH